MVQNKQYDIVGIGEAIMDIIIQMPKEEILQMGLAHGAMINIKTDQMQELQPVLKDATWIPGGSVANSIDLIARLGGKTAMIGALGNDDIAVSLKKDWQDHHVDDLTQQIALPQTGRCHIFVDEHGERSFATYFGLCGDIDFYKIDLDTIGNAKYLLLEGYLWDSPNCRMIFQQIAEHIQREKLDTKIAFTPSDPLLITRHHKSISAFLTQYVQMVFCNARELKALFETQTLDDAIQQAKQQQTCFALTQGANGITIIDGGNCLYRPHQSIAPLDATGAGDSWSGGFLYGLCQGYDIEQAAELAHNCASLIIQHVGARATQDLQHLILTKK